MNSLRRQFFLFFLVVALASSVFLGGIYWSVERSYYLLLDSHLMKDVLELEKLYTEGEEFGRSEPYVLRNPQGLVVDASNLEFIPPLKNREMPYTENLSFGEKTYRFITTKSSRGFYLQYGIDISQAMEFFGLLKTALLSGWLFFLLLLVFFYWLFVKRSLVELEGAVRESLEGREVKVYREIEPLVKSLRERLREIKEQSHHYRDLLMALSHSLKTPLGRLYLRLELLQRRHREVDFSDIRKELQRIEKSSKAFLRLSKLEAQLYSPSFEQCNLRELLQKVLLLYPQERIRMDMQEVILQCDPELAMEVFDVLVDNAIRHGEGEVFIRLEGCTLSVENLSSKPVDENLLEKPESKRLGGVGLYIAKRLCEVLGWSISLRQREEGSLYRVVFMINFCSSSKSS
ncbi:MAG: HAMP domain-containing sensor histidine kinase [Aquificaceae bacterium]|uniref:sensor histidine kinase n=1 Tax=Hydrogenobacter sp. Uz 6-8 TaxID=3384828 RepID=UPI00309D5030